MRPGWDALQDLRSMISGIPDKKPDSITQEVADAADRITAARVVKEMVREGKPLSKLGEIGLRIAAKKEAHDRKADELAARLDAIDKREPAAFAIGDAVIEEREMDLRDMERSMRALSNLPNVVSGKS